MDAAAIAEAVVTKVTSLLERKLAPVLDRIGQLEAREVPTSAAVLKDLLCGEGLTTLVDATVAEYMADNPPPRGEKGADGKDGRDGKDGVDGVGMAGAMIDRSGELIVTTSDGQAIRLGLVVGVDGKDGKDGRDGAAGRDGVDGVGVVGAMIDRGGELTVTTSNGNELKLGPVVGGDGKDGRDGKDGLSFETATGEYLPERGFVIRLAASDRSAEFVLPYMVHRGFWREGLGVKAGESITHDGALWIAKRANASKPCLENCDDWQLAARKGRDGKDGRSVSVPQSPVQLGGRDG